MLLIVMTGYVYCIVPNHAFVSILELEAPSIFLNVETVFLECQYFFKKKKSQLVVHTNSWAVYKRP